MPFVVKIPRSVAPPCMGCQSYSSMVRRLKRAMVLEDRTSGNFEMDIQVTLSKDDPSRGFCYFTSMLRPTHFSQVVSELHKVKQ